MYTNPGVSSVCLLTAKPSYKQLEVKTNRTSFLYRNTGCQFWGCLSLRENVYTCSGLSIFIQMYQYFTRLFNIMYTNPGVSSVCLLTALYLIAITIAIDRHLKQSITIPTLIITMAPYMVKPWQNRNVL
jgi:hypothetical protein